MQNEEVTLDMSQGILRLFSLLSLPAATHRVTQNFVLEDQWILRKSIGGKETGGSFHPLFHKEKCCFIGGTVKLDTGYSPTAFFVQL